MSELFIKQEVLKTLPQLDAIILDIDGVVLDVSQSFRAVICGVTQFYATNMMSLQETGALLEPNETEGFKLAGNFNNDWDLACAAVALVVAKQAQSGATDTAALRAQAPSWEEWTGELKRRGGGLSVAEGFILETLTPAQRREFARGWNPKLVTRLCQEMYGGEACRALYGFAPEHIEGEGFYQRESVLLGPELLPKQLKIGILTGRTHSETQVALRLAGLDIPETCWVTDDDGARKPEAKTLMLLREKMDFRFAVFIGDTMDDLKTVQNLRESRASGKAKVLSCIALSGPSGATHRRLFLEAGAEIVAPDANTFLQYLNHVLK